MKNLVNWIIFWAVLVGLCGAETKGEISRPESSVQQENCTGGLVDVAMPASQVGKTWVRNVDILVDPLANPKELYPGSPERIESQRQLFREMFRDLNAEAWIEVKYWERTERDRAWTIRIERYTRDELADKQWQLRKTSHAMINARLMTIDGEDLIFCPAGAVYPGGVVQKFGGVAIREGRYLISCSPANPESDDIGFIMARLTAVRAGRVRK